MNVQSLLPSRLVRNLGALERRIAAAARSAGRSPEEVRLLPVTKSVSSEVARELAELFEEGTAELAENRAPELEAKAAALTGGPAVRWHFIGHIQRNKARRVVRIAEVVHSVDSVRLVETLGRVAAEEGRRLAIYLQVDRTGEEQKHGLDEAELPAALAAVAAAEALELRGLMAMGPLEERAGRTARDVFDEVAALARRLEVERTDLFAGGRCELSMGMSGDLEAAVAAGSHVVRIGSSLFEGVGREPRG